MRVYELRSLDYEFGRDEDIDDIASSASEIFATLQGAKKYAAKQIADMNEDDDMHTYKIVWKKHVQHGWRGTVFVKGQLDKSWEEDYDYFYVIHSVKVRES